MTEVSADKILEEAGKILGNWLDEKSLNNLKNNGDIKYCIDNCTSPAKKEDIFNAFKIGKPQDVKVLILGQDPYPSGKATGYAFLLNKTVEQKDSLYYILKAIDKNFEPKIIDKNDKANKVKDEYKKWVESNKVLMLNAALTHENPNNDTIKKHRKVWKDFIDAVIKKLLETERKSELVILAWGNKARDCIFRNIKIKNKKELKKETEIQIIKGKMKMLYCYHPSPINENNSTKADTKLLFSNVAPSHFESCKNVKWQDLLKIYNQ